MIVARRPRPRRRQRGGPGGAGPGIGVHLAVETQAGLFYNQQCKYRDY
jgi:hypothetical protein